MFRTETSKAPDNATKCDYFTNFFLLRSENRASTILWYRPVKDFLKVFIPLITIVICPGLEQPVLILNRFAVGSLASTEQSWSVVQFLHIPLLWRFVYFLQQLLFTSRFFSLYMFAASGSCLLLFESSFQLCFQGESLFGKVSMFPHLSLRSCLSWPFPVLPFSGTSIFLRSHPTPAWHQTALPLHQPIGSPVVNYDTLSIPVVELRATAKA